MVNILSIRSMLTLLVMGWITISAGMQNVKAGAVLDSSLETLSVENETALESGVLTGVIRDAQTKETLPGANIILKGTSKGTATDLEGQFRLPRMPVGEQVFVVSYMGYEKKEITIEINSDEENDVTIDLDAISVEGQEVVISVQAQGQREAINQQKTSNKIVSVVSEDRIQEVPDVNAAESIGRLPGVSIQRDGGEANKIAIRGLSPKFNNITINGVRVPSSGSSDRSVDLSLISSSMLDGIEVFKAITPDMDADAIGGSVNLKMKTAPEEFYSDFRLQGGYTALQEDYGNFKFVGSVGKRFLDNDLGVILNVNLDRYNRTADVFSASYSIFNNEDRGGILQQATGNLNLRERELIRSRFGGNIILDYRIPMGQIMLNGIYNEIENDGLEHTNRFDVTRVYHDYTLSEFESTTSVYQFSSNMKQDFNLIKYDVGIAYSQSDRDAPDNYYWEFQERLNAAPGGTITLEDQFGNPELIPGLFSNKMDDTFLTYLNKSSEFTQDAEWTYQANIEVPFSITNSISGYVKTGAKLRSKERSYDRTEIADGDLSYGGGREGRFIIADLFPEKEIDGTSNIPLTYFNRNYSRSNFLDGDYPVGYVIDQNQMRMVTDALNENNMLIHTEGSVNQDYEGTEEYMAYYAMAEVSYGELITVIPGFRVEQDETEYSAKFVSFSSPTAAGELPNSTDTTASRSLDHLLPMVHVKVNPTDWMDVRFAYTETISRPDFSQFAPNTFIGAFRTYVNAPNTNLRNSVSQNLDLSVSMYENRLGFFTVSAFSKKISNLIRFVSFPLVEGQDILPELNLPNISGQPRINTYINSEKPAYVRGMEFDWQTNFWYLPSFLKGIVFSTNLTLIESETEYPRYINERVPIVPRPLRDPFFETVIRDTSNTMRIPSQPSSVANITLGYDYKGFSGRVSFYYQGDVFTGNFGGRDLAENENEELVFVDEDDEYTDDIYRVDISLRQKITNQIEIYSNLNNITNENDQNYMSKYGQYPTYEQFYGVTFDLGIRAKF
jgi:TonB-dependent receptor